MLFFSLLVAVVCCQLAVIRAHCPQDPLCEFDGRLMTITCNTAFASNNASLPVPDLSCFPPVSTYSFLNFERIPQETFRKISFPEKQTLTIKLINVSTIDSNTFSSAMNLPDSSTFVIEIGDPTNAPNIVIEPNAFHQIRVNRLHFLHLSQFNALNTFDTSCFGDEVSIHELTFDHCGLAGFSSAANREVHVKSLSIRNSPAWTQLGPASLPMFLKTLIALKISNTGLRVIHPHALQAWSLILKDLTITHNANLEVFPSEIVDGVLMQLEKLDLSDNPITTLPEHYKWFPYSYTKELVLRNQQVDLFLKSSILKNLPLLEKLDLSEGYVSDADDHLFKNYHLVSANLTSIDVSHTNLSETMVVDLLTRISSTTTHFVNIHLLGHQLADDNFCDYFTIFKNAPDLLNLFLDNSHQCNCVVELFFRDKLRESASNNSTSHPACLLDTSRQRCDIQTQLSTAKCSVSGTSPTSADSDNSIGDYAFGGIVAGTVVVLAVLLSLGFGVVYQIRRRRGTVLTMEHPVENPLAAVVEERLSAA